jgi:hypothetical protein
MEDMAGNQFFEEFIGFNCWTKGISSSRRNFSFAWDRPVWSSFQSPSDIVLALMIEYQKVTVSMYAAVAKASLGIHPLATQVLMAATT